MKGERTVLLEALFCGFSLERHVPGGHLLRSIDRFVDMSGVRTHFEPCYSAIGRLSIDPEQMIPMSLERARGVGNEVLRIEDCGSARTSRERCDGPMRDRSRLSGASRRPRVYAPA